VFYHDKKFIRIILLNEVKEWILEHEDLYYVPDYIIESPSPNIYFNLNYSITSSDFSDEFKEEWFKAFYSKILNKENDELLRRINEDLIVYCEQKNYDIDMLQQLKFDDVVDFIFEFLSEHVYEELKTESNILNHENYTWIDYINDGEIIKTMAELNKVKERFGSGDEMTVTVFRGEEKIDIRLVLSEENGHAAM